ncbi:MAG: carbohydrate kinase family protein [Phycisphaeraceae bacterium]
MDVVGLGNVVVDHLVVLPTMPSPDTKTRVLEDRLQVGGPVPTALVQLSRLGRRCRFLGSWGADALGPLIEADLESEGVDLTGSQRRPGGRTGFAHVWVEAVGGARTIAYGRASEPILPEELDDAHFAGVRALHLDGYPQSAALEAAKRVRRQGGKVFLDTGSLKPGMEELFAHTSVVSCPARFVGELFGHDELERAADELLAMGPEMVTITCGPAGALLRTADERIHEPAFPVAATDTCGAGDVFCGGLIHGVLENWEPRQTIRFAMAAAAVKCTGLGNREALPDRTQIDALLSAEPAGV